MFEMTGRGLFPRIGRREVYWNLIHVDDAARAVLAAVENYRDGLGQTFNVCDDEPVTVRDLLEFIAGALGARKPVRVPVFLAKWVMGSQVVEVLLRSVRCKNDLIKERLGWQPQYPTYRQGMADAIEKWRRL